MTDYVNMVVKAMMTRKCNGMRHCWRRRKRRRKTHERYDDAAAVGRFDPYIAVIEHHVGAGNHYERMIWKRFLNNIGTVIGKAGYVFDEYVHAPLAFVGLQHHNLVLDQ